MSRLLAFIVKRTSTRTEPERSGQAMIEYALIIVLVVVVTIGIVTTIGDILLNELFAAVKTLPLGGD